MPTPTPQQRKKLRDALISAFPEKSRLEQMLYFGLGKHLNEISKDSDLQEVTFNLIRTAESQGWFQDLINAAYQDNRGNLQLKVIALELLSLEKSSIAKSLPNVSAIVTKSTQKPSIENSFNMTTEFDVFLAHNSSDKGEIINIAQCLKQNGLNPWLDKEQILGGDITLEVIYNGIRRSKTGAFFISQNGLGNFQEKIELYVIIAQFLSQKENSKNFRVIPILLPGVSEIPEKIKYMEIWHWIRFTKLNDDEALKLLISSIKYGESSVKEIMPTVNPIDLDIATIKDIQRIPKTEIQNDSIQTEKGLSFEFNLVKVNAEGQMIKREQCQAKYFTENMGKDINLEMVFIPGGDFFMGSPEQELGYQGSEMPQHLVNIKSFYMGKYPITQEQWQSVAVLPQVQRELTVKPSYFQVQGNKRPVEQISWYDAVEFCDRLSQYTNKQYRLPSEAQWEYACRAKTTGSFYFGSTITSKLANYDASKTFVDESIGLYREETTEVGSFFPNAFGLYDFHGNVWEWCLDIWHENYTGTPTDGSNWIYGGDINYRILRGGSWQNYPNNCRSASRWKEFPHIRYNYIGFRIVCNIVCQ